MKPLKPKTHRLIQLLVILTGIAILIYRSLTNNDLLPSILRVGTFASLFAIPLWLLYDRILWRIPMFRVWEYYCNIPDLRGRWEGVIDRGDSRGAHRFVLEVFQTMSEIHCVTYSSRSRARSITADVVSESEHKQALQLVYTWQAEVQEDLNGVVLPEVMVFDGTTILDLHLSNERLEGRYYTNRQPVTTRGRLDLQFFGRQLLGEC